MWPNWPDLWWFSGSLITAKVNISIHLMDFLFEKEEWNLLLLILLESSIFIFFGLTILWLHPRGSALRCPMSLHHIHCFVVLRLPLIWELKSERETHYWVVLEYIFICIYSKNEKDISDESLFLHRIWINLIILIWYAIHCKLPKVYIFIYTHCCNHITAIFSVKKRVISVYRTCRWLDVFCTGHPGNWNSLPFFAGQQVPFPAAAPWQSMVISIFHTRRTDPKHGDETNVPRNLWTQRVHKFCTFWCFFEKSVEHDMMDLMYFIDFFPIQPSLPSLKLT